MKTIEMIIQKREGAGDLLMPKTPIEDFGFGSFCNGIVIKVFESDKERDENMPVSPEIIAEPVDELGYTQSYYEVLKAKLSSVEPQIK